MRKIILVIHNVRSAYNVGSLLRTADGLGVERVYLAGYSPYPESKGDVRLPHIRQRLSRQIHKTALGAQETINWFHEEDINKILDSLVAEGYLIAALEQTPWAQDLNNFLPKTDIALVVGNEVAGLDSQTLKRISCHLKIPMLGQKESFNVAVAAAMALYHLRYSA